VAPGRDASAEASDLVDELRDRRAEEAKRGVTLVGPHRDDIEFAIDGRPARAFASQGQQRTVVLAWKTAELHVVQDVARTNAVLLLDDVMSELDAERRLALTAEVGTSVQTIITTTNTGYFDPGLLDKALVVRIGGVGA
jgi:DNA replication and repair protein RecF